MRVLGLAGMAPEPYTSLPHPQNKIYPYLLRGVNVTRPNQVWSTDITYIRLACGFRRPAALIGWYSRKVLAWRSNTLDSGFCVDCLKQSLRAYGTPDIFNTDQGCQFTSDAFTGVPQDARDCAQHGWARLLLIEKVIDIVGLYMNPPNNAINPLRRQKGPDSSS